MSEAATLCRIVAAEFRRRLCAEQLPRIARCVGLLGDERLWQRPAPNCNSAGNLLMHLCGNTTQWILGTFADVPDHRQRADEFAARSGGSATELLRRLDDTFGRACDAVDHATVAQLLATYDVQVYRETGLAIVLHVLEHCAGHAAQIYAWTKQVTGVDLAFYDL